MDGSLEPLPGETLSNHTDATTVGQRTRQPYDEDFEPIADVADVLYFDPIGEFAIVRAVRSLGSHTISIDVTQNSTEAGQELTGLYVEDKYVAQYRIMDDEDIPDGVELQFDQGGRQLPLHNTKNEAGGITSTTPALTPESNLTELYQYEDNDLFVTSIETAGTTNSAIDVEFSGWVYLFEPLSARNVPNTRPTAIPVQRIDDGAAPTKETLLGWYDV